MSKLIVEVCEIADIQPHPQADRLRIAKVKGWQTIIRHNPETEESEFNIGDKCVYFPPDSVMSKELAERLGVINFLGRLPKQQDGFQPELYRVRAARLRGIPSFGLAIPVIDNQNWNVGDDVAEFYGITKWQPHAGYLDDNADVPHPAFHTYTDIQHWGNFPNVFTPGEEVVITEKIHGQNCRVGLINTADEVINPEWTFMCGSNTDRRKQFNLHGKESEFWKALTPAVSNMLKAISNNKDNVVVFGEIFGPDIQKLHYGIANKEQGFRIFDISINGKYLDYDQKVTWCQNYGIPIVPLLYRGPYSQEVVEQYTNGPTTLCEPEKLGKFKGREGVVVTSTKERFAPTGNDCRAILKSVSVDYLAWV